MNYPQQNTVIRLGKQNRRHLQACYYRLQMVIALFLIAFGVIGFRLFAVSVVKHEADVVVANNQMNFDVTRAEILDRHGVLLATNLTTASLYANPKVILDVEAAIKQLRTVFPKIKSSELSKKLNSSRHFVWIKRNLTPKEHQAVNSLGIPGLYFQKENRRVYPHNNLLSHVLGFTDVDGRGIAGIEKEFDRYLSGYNDYGQNNSPLELSIDVRVQGIVHDLLQQGLYEHRAKAASAVVMDVNNGEVLSWVSLPDFNPNTPGLSSDTQRFNRTSLGVYEMGSTFKSFNIAQALDEGLVKIHDTFDVSEPIRSASFTIRDYHPKKSVLDLSEAFMYSSNIASAKIAMEFGAKRQESFLRRLGLLDRLEIELTEVAKPLYPKLWNDLSTMTVSYGHGIAVTPLHVAKATASMVNGGIVYPLTLIHGRNNHAFSGRRIISEKTSQHMRELLRYTVSEGTGKNADAEGYMVGGKTGTADKPGRSGYSKYNTIASFVGAFPMNAPQYVVFVMYDEPQPTAKTHGFVTGGMVAAPVVKKIIQHIGPLLELMPVEPEEDFIRNVQYNYATNSKTRRTTEAF